MKEKFVLLILISLFLLAACGSKREERTNGEVKGPLPDTIIEQHPASTTSDRNATFTFASTQKDVYFKCNIDDGGWSTCSSPVTYTSLSEGRHNFKVKAVDFYGREDTTPAEFFWSIITYWIKDNGSIDAGVVSGNSLDLSDQINGGDKNLCSIDGLQWQDCDLSQIDISTLSDGDHILEVKLLTLCRNTTDQFCGEADYVVNFKRDTTPPDTLLSSSPLSCYNNRTFTFTFISSEEGTFQCNLDGGEWFSCDSPYSMEVTEDGEHLFKVRAVDEAGNVDPTPAKYRWNVDTTPPVVSFDSVPTNPSNSPYATVRFISSEPARFYCSLDGNGWNSCSSPFKTPFLSNGSHTIKIYAIDEAGNKSDIKSYSWDVNVTPPDTIIDSKPDTFINYTDVTFTFHSDKDNVIFQCKLDKNNWINCGSPVNYSNLSEGRHTFEVIAVDQYGYRNPAPVEYTWTVDLTPPVLAITSTPDNPTDFKNATFTFRANETMKEFQCKLDDGDWTDCGSNSDTGSISYHSLGSGNHTFYLKGQDLAGNDGSVVSYQWRVFSWIYVSAGYYHTCAIRDDNSLWCWGRNNHGQLGIGNTSNKNVPVRVNSWSWKMVSAGGYHTCAVATNNVLDCWGYNYYGQLGIGSTQDRHTPAWVGSNYDTVSAGYLHTCGIDTDGYLYCWGYNYYGQIGDGTTTERDSPVSIGSDWIYIAAGGHHTCGYKNDGYLYCWGRDASGEVGDGDDDNANETSPEQIMNLLVSGISGGYLHTCAVRMYLLPSPGSEVLCWGYNYYGQIGNDDYGDGSNVYSPVLIKDGIDEVAAGGGHTCALDSTDLYCWGRNGDGQLGLGNTVEKHTPQYVSSGWNLISAGYAHTCGIKTDGTLWCWGLNASGDLGVRDWSDRHSPTHVYPSPWP